MLFKTCSKKYKYAFSCVDHLSKYKWRYPLSDKTALAIKQCLQNVFATFGPPAILQSDNGKEFTNKELDSYLKSFKINLIHGSVRHLQSWGLVERHNHELKRLFGEIL